MTTQDVVVYSSPTCASCKSAKDFLTAKGVRFTEKDITQDKNAQELETRTGDNGTVPVIVVGKSVVVGFDRPKLQAALGLS